jgi:hypothetical protein
MSNGPPWIEKIELSNVPGEPLRNLPRLCGYHVALDEYERFTIVSEVARGMHKPSEISVNFVKPTFYGGEVFLIMNDNFSEYPLTRAHYRFDHENLYVYAQWKERYDPNTEWLTCQPINYLVSSNLGDRGVMEFSSGPSTGQIDVRVTITHE